MEEWKRDAMRRMKADEDVEKNTEMMDETWLLVHANTFKDKVNAMLSRPMFQECSFHEGSLKIGKPCGQAMWDDLCCSNLPEFLGTVLRGVERQLTTLHVERIVIERDFSSKYSIDVMTLTICHEFGSIDNNELSGKERSIIKEDIAKTIKKNMGYLERYMDEDDPYAAWVDADLDSSARCGTEPMQAAIPPEKRYKKSGTATATPTPAAPAAAVAPTPAEPPKAPPVPPPMRARVGAAPARVAAPMASRAAPAQSPAPPQAIPARVAPPPMRGRISVRATPTRMPARGAPMTSQASPPPPPPLPQTVAAPTVPGQWSLRERKQIGEKQGVLDNAIAAIQARLGEEWTVKIDWASFDTHTKDKGTDRPAGDNVVVKIVSAFVRVDLDKWTDDMVAAINRRCEKKLIEVSMEPTVRGDGRASANATFHGVTIKFRAESWGMPYNEDYMGQIITLMDDW
jgi:hypothetical protein